ncbi:hypothetical protein [Brevundimonas viscosa]|uniref:Uncharacterized protein n=1 Tax=Brevundimonas viscosa TaxID=871741 RepID=A0A1I6TE29_9CAUL|nr:hypothetical protein [Brevundimonas viscosa]SFS87464.1 hypothetical protein SAMN05192570_3172 [Brevundimonas viscosa]
MEVAIDFYLISIRRKRKRGLKLLPFHDFDGKGTSGVAELAKSLIPMVKGNYKGIPEKTITVKNLKTDKVGFIGTFEQGAYGREGDVIDVTTGNSVLKKKKHHAEKIPYYFRVYVPLGADKGYLITQRLGLSGVSGNLKSIFREYFENAHPEYIVDIRSLAPDFIVKRFIKGGEPRSVTFIKHSIPPDYADVVSGKSVQSEGSIEVTYKSKEKGFFRKKEVANAITSTQGIKSVYAFDDFEPDDVKMTVDVNGKLRTISLQNQRNVRSSFDITDDVKLASSGYPARADVDAQTVILIKELANATGIKI